MRALVTGADGFVGHHLCAELRARGVETLAGGRPGQSVAFDVPIDLEDPDGMRVAVADARPAIIFHLAAQAFVPLATEDPLGTYRINIMGTAYLIDAVRALPEAARPRVLFTSSGEVYGTHDSSELPLRESTPTRPATVYAASKLAGEAIVLSSAGTFGFPAIVTRSFNHIGPGQSDRFVVAGFASRLAAIAAGGDPLLEVGNLSTQRDFLDVRDVVRAYADLALHGASGEVYNVCSGVPTRIAEVLRHLVGTAHVAVEIREDATRLRQADVPLIYGDNTKLRAATGWAPRYSLARSLRDVYEAARSAAAAK